MSIAKVSEVISSSNKSFEDAISKGVERANKTLENVKAAWVENQQVIVEDGKIKEYRVALKITFVLSE